MRLENLNSIASRIFFLSSLVLLVVAGSEKIVNLFGYTILQATPYGASRLLELASVLLMFVLALLLRQIREEMKKH